MAWRRGKWQDVSHAPRGTPLTPREQECMELYCQGYRRDQIAARLNCGYSNVTQMLQRASDRLGASTKVQGAIKYAMRKKEPLEVVPARPIPPCTTELPSLDWRHKKFSFGRGK